MDRTGCGRRWGRGGFWLALAALALTPLGCDGDGEPAGDAGVATDAGPPQPVSTDHCDYQPVPPTSGAGGVVEAGALEAGAAEGFLEIPLGASMASYTSRAEGVGAQGFLPEPDERRTQLSGTFAPSVGIETAPKVRALALRAGGETVLIVKVDLSTSYQGFVHDLEAALGPEMSGKVIVAGSHSHSSFGNYSGHSALAVGFGLFQRTVYEAILQSLEAVARAALADLRPARIGIAYDPDFDPDNRVNRSRRSANDELAGGSFDDHHLFVIRVDALDGSPLAVLPVFGIHGILLDGTNSLVSTDSTGGIERVLEESFDSTVLVMHMQGSGGDVSPAGRGSIDCGGATFCEDFAKAETVGRYARDAILAAWESAGESMRDSLEIEMLTRTVPLGPDWETFTVRDGALRYAPWDGVTPADGRVYDEAGQLISPIDEFNAPYGAALCGSGGDLGVRLQRTKLPGTDELSDYSYYFCGRIDRALSIFEGIVDAEFEAPPLCGTTRTTVSALRLGDWMIATLPGEPITLLGEHVRALSPLPPERTIVFGYAQDHGGYLLRPEDWLAGGYEPSISFWGPLEGEYVAERAAEMMALATTPEREDAAEGGAERVRTPMRGEEVPFDEPALEVGSVPASLPPYVLTRMLREVPQAQPPAQVPRLSTAFFTWVGDDPLRGTPRVTLQREVEGSPGTFEDVLRRSGRPVQDGDLILTWTPDPIERQAGVARTHYYTVELQAVAPMGLPDRTELTERFGLPLGSYRFHVQAPTYELTSDPFEVVPAELSVTSETSGSDLMVTLAYDVPSDGFRLLDMEARSNGPIPLRSAAVEVDVDGTASSQQTGADGTLTLAGAAGADTITVTDAFGNSATFAP